MKRHLAEIVAALEEGESLLAGAGNELADQNPALEHDVHRVARIALVEDDLAALELALLGERSQEVDLERRELLFGEEVALGGDVEPELAGRSSLEIGGFSAASFGPCEKKRPSCSLVPRSFAERLRQKVQ
jgi:hypothetical protein